MKRGEINPFEAERLAKFTPFFHPPLSALPSVRLAACFPVREKCGFTLFCNSDLTDGLSFAYTMMAQPLRQWIAKPL
jgi:hypothetical protein